MSITKNYNLVYKTTCLITGKYYIGVHSTNDVNDGYIGSGIRFMNHVKKYNKSNLHREILQFFDTRDEAFECERQLITEDVLQDKLCLNLIKGGVGYRHQYNETFRDRLRKTKKRKIESGEIIPFKHSEEHKQRLREHNPGGEATAKPIYQIDCITGEVINIWKSTRQAGIGLGIKVWRNISRSANVNKNQTVGGYYWRWVGDVDVVNNQLININQLNDIRLDKSMRSGKLVNQLDVNGNIIKQWKSASDVSRELSVSVSAISCATKRNGKCKGYYWSYVKIVG